MRLLNYALNFSVVYQKKSSEIVKKNESTNRIILKITAILKPRIAFYE